MEWEVVDLGIEVQVGGWLQIRRCLGKRAEVGGGSGRICRRRSSPREVFSVHIHVEPALRAAGMALGGAGPVGMAPGGAAKIK
jgi:hypothetical protein